MTARIPLVDVLASGRFIQGAETRPFEERFQSWRLLFQLPLDIPCPFLSVAEVQVSG